jgi:Holliday junction resolvasome RuvABC DNA-binding subunit
LTEPCQAPGADVETLTSIRGIGGKTAADFLIEMGGEIQRFETHNKLIAVAGLESVEIGLWREI